MIRSILVRSLSLLLLPVATTFASGAEPLKIVAFGDSTTAIQPFVRQVFSQRLPALLKARGLEARVINAGADGSHTGSRRDHGIYGSRHGMERFESDVRAQKAQIVIIQFGINDSWIDTGVVGGRSRIPLPDYERNLKHFIGTLQVDGARVILMTPNRLGTRYHGLPDNTLGSYAKAVHRLAKSEKTSLVDVWSAFSKWDGQLDGLMTDGMHPNDVAHELIAGLLLPEIVRLAKALFPPKVVSFAMPLIDLDGEKHRQVVVDREKGQYLGHPTTCLLEDGKTILCVYPKGHGRGPIVYKRSTDGGLTWGERLPTPESWATSLEVPTLHRVVDAAGTTRIIMWSGLYPARLAVSEDDGATWSELNAVGDWGGIVVMGCVEKLRTGSGHYVALFHDDGRYFTENGRREKPVRFKLFKTFSRDGGLNWSFPEVVYESTEVHLCEPGLVRSPDGKQLAVLLRENRRVKNSHIIFSNDEAKSWSEPRELPKELTGDRHTGRYLPDGRLFLTFRDRTPKHWISPTAGDWAGWIGSYDDLLSGRPGQYRLRLKENHKGADCAYPGVEVLPDGTVVTTTYGHWDPGEQPYILSVRFTGAELDERAK